MGEDTGVMGVNSSEHSQRSINIYQRPYETRFLADFSGNPVTQKSTANAIPQSSFVKHLPYVSLIIDVRA